MAKSKQQTTDAGYPETPWEGGNPIPLRGDRISAHAAGAGTGTLLVILAQSLPENNPLKSWLVLAAPATSVSLSIAWVWIKATLEARTRGKEQRELFLRIQGTIARAIDSPHISFEHKRYLIKRLEEMKRLEVSEIYKRIKTLGGAAQQDG